MLTRPWLSGIMRPCQGLVGGPIPPGRTSTKTSTLTGAVFVRAASVKHWYTLQRIYQVSIRLAVTQNCAQILCPTNLYKSTWCYICVGGVTHCAQPSNMCIKDSVLETGFF